MEPLTVLIRVAIGVLIVANVSALIFAFLRFRATGDLPPTIPQPVESSPDKIGVGIADRLSDLEAGFKRIEREFNDLHSTVETRHRSLSGLVSKKLGRPVAAAEADDDDEPRSVPKSAYEKLAELEAQHAPPPPPAANGGRRHLRRF